MPAFDVLTTPTVDPVRLTDGDRHHYRLDVPDGWQQGRGAFGGFVLASMVRACSASAAAPDRRLRTLTAEICGPVLTGPAEIRVEPLRVGSGTSTLAARLLQGGEVQAHVVAVLGRARPVGEDYVSLERPTPRPWRECMVLPVGPPMGPVFTPHFEYRPTGPLPFSGGSEARVAGWVRPRNPGALRDDAYVVGCIDAYWPAWFTRTTAPRPMATITFTLDVLGTCEGLDPEAPLFHESHTLATREGFSPEVRVLWGEDGRLLAINHQTFVMIK